MHIICTSARKSTQEAPFRYAFDGGTIGGMHKKTIHTILAELIARKGIKPTELAALSGVNQSTISRILNHKILTPKDEPVRKLADYFGITTDQLRGFQPLQPPTSEIYFAPASACINFCTGALTCNCTGARIHPIEAQNTAPRQNHRLNRSLKI